MSKADTVFKKYAGIGSYVKTLLDATKELPFNTEAFKIYSKEIARNSREITKLKTEEFLNDFNKFREGEADIDKLIRKTSEGSVEKRIQNLASGVNRFKNLRKPHAKKIRQGLVLPAVGVGATVGTGQYIRTKIREDELKP